MQQKYEVLAVIPARGGSKGIPRKNVKDLCGKPLIAYTIEAAKKSAYITRVIVSTDDEEIANIAKEYGCEVPFLRPKDISGDLATDVEFLTHALDFLKSNEEYIPDIIIRLPPTSPLRKSEDIDNGIMTLIKTPGATASRPICSAPKHPYKMWKIADDGVFIEPFLSKEITGMDEPYNMPRQLLPKVFIHTGAMDVIWRDTVLNLKSTSGKKLAFFYMKEEDSINIDSPMDFVIAETLLKQRLL